MEMETPFDGLLREMETERAKALFSPTNSILCVVVLTI